MEILQQFRSAAVQYSKGTFLLQNYQVTTTLEVEKTREIMDNDWKAVLPEFKELVLDANYQAVQVCNKQLHIYTRPVRTEYTPSSKPLSTCTLEWITLKVLVSTRA